MSCAVTIAATSSSVAVDAFVLTGKALPRPPSELTSGLPGRERHRERPNPVIGRERRQDQHHELSYVCRVRVTQTLVLCVVAATATSSPVAVDAFTLAGKALPRRFFVTA